MDRKKLIKAIGLALLFALAVDQIVQHTAMADGELMGRRIAPFDPPLFHTGQRESFAKLDSYVRTGTPTEESFHLDAELGWCPTPGLRIGDKNWDWAACRVSSAPLERERRPGLKRIVTVGCSFTLGEEVQDDETWPYLLDQEHDDIEFANLAMSAYGIDQALMRYKRDGRALEGDEVWLGLLPAATLRVVSLYRPAQRHWTSSVVFKPRYVLGADGALQLIPCPAQDARSLHGLVADQEAFFAATSRHDAWVSRTPLAYAPAGSSVLHRFASGRLALTLLDSRMRSLDDWMPDRQGEVHQLVLAICEEFAREVEASGARFRVIVLPGRPDLQSLAEDGSGAWSALTDDLRAAGIEVLDCSQDCLAAGSLTDDTFWAPGGHYSPRGNRVIAQRLNALL